MGDSTRKRSPNWLPSEKEILLSLVELHFDIIENKKTDSASIKTKLAQWEVISEEYNSRTTHFTRTGANLKSQWESMKKVARKDAANKRKQMIQSGGEPPTTKKEDPFQQRIISLIGTGTVGSLNQHDVDSSGPTERDGTIITTVVKEELSYEPQVESIDSETPSVVSSQPSDTDVESETEKVVTKDRGENTQQKLKTPVLLTRKNKPTEEETHQRPWVSRRRPNQSITSSSLEQLQKKKLEAIEVQTKLAVEEMERSKVLHDIDVQIKKQILKQEKIKTNILLIKQRQLLGFRKRK